MVKSKLVLDYIKTLIWPVIVLIVILSFHGAIRDFIDRLTEVKGPGGTVLSAAPKNNLDPELMKIQGNAPTTWYGYRDVHMSQEECFERGNNALNNAGYKGIRTYESTIYGYSDDYVASIWFAEKRDMAFVIVAGPNSDVVKEKWQQLNGFF